MELPNECAAAVGSFLTDPRPENWSDSPPGIWFGVHILGIWFGVHIFGRTSGVYVRAAQVYSQANEVPRISGSRRQGVRPCLSGAIHKKWPRSKAMIECSVRGAIRNSGSAKVAAVNDALM